MTKSKAEQQESFDEKKAWIKRVRLLLDILSTETVSESDEDGADAPVGSIVDADSYRLALLKMLKRLGPTPMNFGLVLGDAPSAHRLLLHKSRLGRALASSLTGDTGLTVATWGIADVHPDAASTMRLSVEGKPLSRVRAQVEGMLKAFAPLPFSKVRLSVNGQLMEEDSEPDETEGPAFAPTRVGQVKVLWDECTEFLDRLSKSFSDSEVNDLLLSICFKIELIATDQGDKQTATELVALALQKVRASAQANGIKLNELKNTQRFASLASKLGVLEGGLKGGGPPILQLHEIEEMGRTDLGKAMEEWGRAYANACEDHQGGEKACYQSLLRMAKESKSPALLSQAVVIARALNLTDEAKAIAKEAIGLAEEKGDANAVTRTAGEMLKLGVDPREVADYAKIATEIAVSTKNANCLDMAVALWLEVDKGAKTKVANLLHEFIQQGEDALKVGDVLMLANQIHSADRNSKHIYPAAQRALKLASKPLQAGNMADAAYLLNKVRHGDEAVDALHEIFADAEAGTPQQMDELLAAVDVGHSFIGFTVAQRTRKGGEVKMKMLSKSVEATQRVLAAATKGGWPNEVQAACDRLLEAAQIYQELKEMKEAEAVALAAGKEAQKVQNTRQMLVAAKVLKEIGQLELADKFVVGALEIDEAAVQGAIESGDVEAVLEFIEDLRPSFDLLSDAGRADDKKQALANVVGDAADALADDGETSEAISMYAAMARLDPRSRSKAVGGLKKAVESVTPKNAPYEFDEEAALEAIGALLDPSLAPNDLVDEQFIPDVLTRIRQWAAEVMNPARQDVIDQVADAEAVLAKLKQPSQGDSQGSGSSSEARSNLDIEKMDGDGSEDEEVFEKIEDVKTFKYSSHIGIAKSLGGGTVIHYNSMAASLMTKKDREKVEKFAERVTRDAIQAADELVGGRFAKWDATKPHLQRVLDLQDDWALVKGDKALFYDLAKLRAVQANKQLETKPYNDELAEDIKKATVNDELDESVYLEHRRARHKTAEKQKLYAEKRSLGMLHQVAGYLVEERTYQLMPSKEESKWSDQDTQVLGGGTRPDISVPVGDSGKLFALLDITASDSQGHIFDKQPLWTNSLKICDSVEIMYPSMDQGTLLKVLLEKKSFTSEEVQRMRAEHLAATQDKQREQREDQNLVLDTLNKLQGPAFRKMIGSKTDAEHLLKAHGITRKGFHTAKTLNRARAEAAMLRLKAYLSDQQQSQVAAEAEEKEPSLIGK